MQSKVKFIFADSLDQVDPEYNFINDTHKDGRTPYWDDQFPHEMLGRTPYDGILVSRATVGSPNIPGYYTESQSMRFLRVGAREFLRFNKPKDMDKMVFGDCGAFSYSKQTDPPYTAEDTVEFYGEGQFTHGCSIDHIIFEFDSNSKGMKKGCGESRRRYDITLQLASEFFHESKKLDKNFTPVGVVQGWSPDSLAESAKHLIKIGYRYLAIGGLVPLKIDEIHLAVSSVHDAVKRWPSVKLHLLGFAKSNYLHEFTKYSKIASFDSTSPMIRAFKDGRNNYYLPNGKNRLNYYTAIRIPQAIENRKLKDLARTGLYKQEDLLKMEKNALQYMRLYDKGKVSIEKTIDALIEYTKPLKWTSTSTEDSLNKTLHNTRLSYIKTLEDMPWKKCKCNICKQAGVETIIFRGNNRNKRRGMHNLSVFYQHLKRIS